MESVRHELVGRLFLKAIELRGPEREAFLEEACGGDAALRAEVLAMLTAEDAPTEFLDQQPALGGAMPRLEPASLLASGMALPDRIGPYEIEAVLGEGGMGVVYRARQHDPDRVVALKMIRAGVSTLGGLKRFEHEKQVLARLHHPGIAQIYDAGTVDVGTGKQPYFAMEYIEGEPLTTHAAQHHLDVGTRCRLLMRCCAAVEHAHQKGVIHRDLKPANILVEAGDQPRILDFGVARVTSLEDGAAVTMNTGVGQIIGTLPYMSPEQVAGPSDDLDTRSDVYALGVIAYELLAGRLPLDLDSRGIAEAARIISEEEPLSLGRTRAQLRGDLSTIVGKALEKDRSRRYQSAAAFADDLERYLEDRPIAARPTTTIYRIRKYARRNRIAFASIVLVLAALVLGIAGTSAGLVRATREGRRLEAMNEYFRSMLTSLTPYRAQGEDVSVRDMVRTAEESLDSMLGAEPLVRAEVEATIGAVYRALGDLEAAERVLLAGAARAEQHGGPAHAATLSARTELGRMYNDQGRHAEAAELGEVVLAQQRARLGWDDPVTLDAANLAGWSIYLTGEFDRAAAIFRDTVERRRRILGAEDPATLLTQTNLALVLTERGEAEEAAAVIAEVVAAQERNVGPRHPNTLYAKHVEANAWADLDRFAEAAERHREVVRVAEEVLGAEHGYTLFWRIQLAADLRRAGDLDAAARHAEEVLDLRRTLVGGGSGNLVDALNELSAVRRGQARHVEAEQLAREAMRIAIELEPTDRLRVWWSRFALAGALAGQGEADDALDMLHALERDTAEVSAPAQLRRVIEEMIERIANPPAGSADTDGTGG